MAVPIPIYRRIQLMRNHLQADTVADNVLSDLQELLREKPDLFRGREGAGHQVQVAERIKSENPAQAMRLTKIALEILADNYRPPPFGEVPPRALLPNRPPPIRIAGRKKTRKSRRKQTKRRRTTRK
uniref:Uncharacterized protein n=1 Tax=viral metagenome TaxID=1070528 RepID=A0A6C0J317_9ZZZZ